MKKLRVNPAEEIIAIDRNVLLSSCPDWADLVIEFIRVQAVREDILAILEDGSIGMDLIILEKNKVSEGILRVLNELGCVLTVSGYAADVSFPVAVEVEIRKTSVEKKAKAYYLERAA